MDNFPLQNVRDIFPQFHDHGFIDRQYAFLTLSFMKQSILKQFLTEGNFTIFFVYCTVLHKLISLSEFFF